MIEYKTKKDSEKDIWINGMIRLKQKNVILTIYSTPLARLFLKKELKSVDINYNKDGFVLTRGSSRRVQIERKNEDCPLVILYVARFIPKKIKEELKKDKKQKKVKVLIKNICNTNELLTQNKRIVYKEIGNLNLIIPPSEKIKVGCHVSCQRNKKSNNYRLNIRHKALEKIAINKIPTLVGRNKKGEFIIRRSKRGQKFNFYRNKNGHPLAYMQISPNLISKKEKELFNKEKRAIFSRAYLSSKEFVLDISKFFMTQDERELASVLIENKINIRIPEMRKREADIVLRNSGIQIEITKIQPRKGENNRNSPHTDGMHINGRICEGYLRVKKENVPIYFVIFDEKWKKYKWVKNLIQLVKPKVKCLTTDFKKGWDEKITKEIILILKKEKIKDDFL